MTTNTPNTQPTAEATRPPNFKTPRPSKAKKPSPTERPPDMSNEPTITLEGNLTADPELRFTPSGVAVADFTVAQTPRRYDRQSSEWKDGDTLFMHCTAWRELAENVANCLRKGMGVLVTGDLSQRSYETRDGGKRTVVELTATNIGPSLQRQTAQVVRTQRRQQQGAPQQAPAQAAPVQQLPQQDEWGQQSAFPSDPPF